MFRQMTNIRCHRSGHFSKVRAENRKSLILEIAITVKLSAESAVLEIVSLCFSWPLAALDLKVFNGSHKNSH